MHTLLFPCVDTPTLSYCIFLRLYKDLARVTKLHSSITLTIILSSLSSNTVQGHNGTHRRTTRESRLPRRAIDQPHTSRRDSHHDTMSRSCLQENHCNRRQHRPDTLHSRKQRFQIPQLAPHNPRPLRTPTFPSPSFRLRNEE